MTAGNRGKLTDEQRAEMRRLYSEDGWGYGRLAMMFGVRLESVRCTVNPDVRQRHSEKAKASMAAKRAARKAATG